MGSSIAPYNNNKFMYSNINRKLFSVKKQLNCNKNLLDIPQVLTEWLISKLDGAKMIKHLTVQR